MTTCILTLEPLDRDSVCATFLCHLLTKFSSASEWPKVMTTIMPPPCLLTSYHCFIENARVRFFWNNEGTSFSDYFLNVYSPGEATHADLIIVNAGLYWMFQQCKHAVTDSGQKADFETQTVICRDNLETILANLPFHQPSKLETVSSMIIAVSHTDSLSKYDANTIPEHVLSRNMQAIRGLGFCRNCVSYEPDARHAQQGANGSRSSGNQSGQDQTILVALRARKRTFSATWPVINYSRQRHYNSGPMYRLAIRDKLLLAARQDERLGTFTR